jgi:O-antigen/teichoic acid export membrane protein
MSKESKLAFFRQSGWLVIATGLCGVFLMAVYPLVSKILGIATFFTMLRFFTVFGIVTSGLQVVMAQQAASALTPELKALLGVTVRSVARGIFFFWVLVVLVCAFFKNWFLDTLKIPNGTTLAITLGLLLAQLFLPFVQGLLQGTQNFASLGWSIMLNGIGRFLGIFILLKLFKASSATALAGALLGLGAAVLLGAWPSRGLFFSGAKGRFDWPRWLAGALPLSAGAGAIVFLMNADVLFVQAHFSRAETAYYAAVAIVGVGLVTFTSPMASVMFPKLVRSVAQAQKNDSLLLAATGTAALGLFGALTCTLFPSLPLRIMFFNNAQLWVAAQLVPAFMWSMLPVTMANLLVGNLLARRDFRAVPWLAAIAAAYGFELNRYLSGVPHADLFAAFKGVVFRLGMFSAMMLVVAFLYSLFPRSRDREG